MTTLSLSLSLSRNGYFAGRARARSRDAKGILRNAIKFAAGKSRSRCINPPLPRPPLLRFCRSLVAAEFFPCGNFSFPPSPSPSPSPSPIPRTAFTSRFRRWRLDTSAGRGVGRLCRSRGYLLATDGAYKETKSAFCDCSRSIAAAQRAPAPALLPRDRTRPYCGRVAAITPVSPLPPPRRRCRFANTLTGFYWSIECREVRNSSARNILTTEKKSSPRRAPRSRSARSSGTPYGGKLRFHCKTTHCVARDMTVGF